MTAILLAISREQAKKGFPIVINDPLEMVLIAGVLAVLAVPLYLSHRRRSLRRTLDK